MSSYPNELLFVLLEIVNQGFLDAKMQQSEPIVALFEMVSGHVDRGVANEIVDKFFIHSKVQFQQHLQKLHEKCKALELERKNLQFKLKQTRTDARAERAEDGEEKGESKEPDEFNKASILTMVDRGASILEVENENTPSRSKSRLSSNTDMRQKQASALDADTRGTIQIDDQVENMDSDMLDSQGKRRSTSLNRMSRDQAQGRTAASKQSASFLERKALESMN